MLDQSCPWSFLEHQKHEFCERELCSLVVQPGNTWTNITYLIVAIFILRTKSDHTKNERLIFGISTLLLFFGSTFFHMSGTHIGKMVDISAMFLLSMGILSLAMQKQFLLSTATTLIFFVVGFSASLYPLWMYDNGYYTFGAQVALAAMLEFHMLRGKRSTLDGKMMLSSVGTLLVAFMIWIMDRNKIMCDPDNHLLPGHGVWHILTAIAIYLLFKAKKAQT